MTEVSEILWPYGFMAVVWSVLCGSLLLRTIRSESDADLETNDSEWLWDGAQSPQGRDTQAGRI